MARRTSAASTAVTAVLATMTGAAAGAAIANQAVKEFDRRRPPRPRQRQVPPQRRPRGAAPAPSDAGGTAAPAAAAIIAAEAAAPARLTLDLAPAHVGPDLDDALLPEAVEADAAPPKPERTEAGDLVAPSDDVRERTAEEVGREGRVAALRMKVGFTAGIIATIAALQLVRSVVWSHGIVPRRWYDVLLSYGAWTWVFPVAPIVFALIGFYRFGWLPTPTWRDDRTDPLHRPCPHEVCFRVVSRGTNPDALERTVETIYEEMAALPLFPWLVEVVCDVDPGLVPRPGLHVHVVPDEYATEHGSLFKARALNYALEVSQVSEVTWLLHLDEESRITPSLIRGVRDAVIEEETSGRLRIGQGAILYHGHLSRHTNLTLADMIRTGDDVGRFHFQHRLGVTVFGLHGSFILVRSDVERQVSFDVGPEGSITEDAFWALRQMAAGHRIRWVDGFLSEQSPESVTDFIKQRRRWFTGLTRCVLYTDAPWWCRLPLGVYLVFWSVAWASMLYTVLNLVLFGFRTPDVVAILADFSFAGYAMFYALGLWLNLRDRGGLGRRERLGLYVSLIVLFPAYIVVEAIAVVLGMVRPDRTFHVVRKEGAGR